MYKHDKINIIDDYGVQKEAIAPVIISASRSTDIPAFYSEWFFKRLNQGYCAWINPFNNKKTYISFKNSRVIVFWTKNPEPILPYLHQLDLLDIHYYFQYTLNDYENENLEPNVPNLNNRIKVFKFLSSLIGPERVIWRYDPLILTPNLTTRSLLTKIWNIGNKLKGYTHKLVFSFVDINQYKKVKNNLINEVSYINFNNINSLELDISKRLEIINGLQKIIEEWNHQGWNISLASCGEDINLISNKITPNRCVDGALISKLFGYDKKLLNWLHTGKINSFQSDLFVNTFSSCSDNLDFNKLKDKGQRNSCGCILSKDIGIYNTCKHFCVYCYANTNRKFVNTKIKSHNSFNESII